jgi:DNA-3-methyladenine glycosylase II
MNLTLACEGPLDVAATLSRYQLWGEDPANRVDGEVFHRVLRTQEALWPYEVRWRGPIEDVRLSVTVPGARSAAIGEAVTAEVRRIFGLDFDLPGFYRMAKGDPALAGLIEPLHGMRPTLSPTPLEMLVGSITAQQINLSFAFACRARLVRRYGTRMPHRAVELWAFPDAAALARVKVREMLGLKFSTRKAEYIRDLAREVVAGRLDLDALAGCPSADVIARLTTLRGLGRWTADWFLARGCGRGDVCPAGDLAVRKAFDHYYGRGRTLSEVAIRRRARAWGPYQNLAVHYLLAGTRLGGRRVGGDS